MRCGSESVLAETRRLFWLRREAVRDCIDSNAELIVKSRARIAESGDIIVTAKALIGKQPWSR